MSSTSARSSSSFLWPFLAGALLAGLLAVTLTKVEDSGTTATGDAAPSQACRTWLGYADNSGIGDVEVAFDGAIAAAKARMEAADATDAKPLSEESFEKPADVMVSLGAAAAAAKNAYAVEEISAADYKTFRALHTSLSAFISAVATNNAADVADPYGPDAKKAFAKASACAKD